MQPKRSGEVTAEGLLLDVVLSAVVTAALFSVLGAWGAALRTDALPIIGFTFALWYAISVAVSLFRGRGPVGTLATALADGVGAAAGCIGVLAFA